MIHEFSKSLVDKEVIFEKDDHGDKAYIVDSGRVEIYLTDGETETPISVLGVGEIFGEMALVDGSPRSASARALGECQLTSVSKDQLSERIEQADPIVRLLVNMLIKRIRENNDKLTKSIPGNESLDVKKESKEELEVIKKIKFEKELEVALEEKQFTMHYQPIIDLSTKQIAGFEALIRWNSPIHGLVRPDIFMGLAEETSLIVPISNWVFEESCRTFKHYQVNFPFLELFMSINISGKQFSDPLFLEKIQTVIKNLSLKPSDIKLEVTETLLVEGEFVKNQIDALRDLGFMVSLDDFGTGYSSLSYLSDFSFDNLKIDKSFIDKMNTDKNTAVIIEAIINMSKGLEVPVIAEGIESPEDARKLHDLGCKYGQGYYFSKPIDKHAIIKLLQDNPKFRI